MDWLPWVSIAALFIGVWHELNRFPAVDRSFNDIIRRVDDLESENRDLKDQLSKLDDDYLALTIELERIKDPAYYEALDAGDGSALYNMDKDREGS